jgi:hypothetical protein
VFAAMPRPSSVTPLSEQDSAVYLIPGNLDAV